MNKDVEKIRAEIERRRIMNFQRKQGSRSLEDMEILSFIDSLQEDPELSEKEQKVANVYSKKLKDKRLLPTLNGDLKHKFLNEFNTLYQTLDMQLCDRCMKEPLKDLCLAFAAWGAYNLKNYFGMSNEEKSKMDSLQEEPKTDWLQELQEKLDSLSKEDFKKVWAKYKLREEGSVDYDRLNSMLDESLAKETKESWNKKLGEEEPVSEELELEEEITKCYESRIDLMMTKKQFGEIIHHFIEWQKERIMANSINATIGLPYKNKDGGYTHLIDVSRPLPVGDNKIVIIFKED